MHLSTIAKTRLYTQQIAHQQLDTLETMVSWMGAIQGQDYKMAKWAMGLRLPGETDATLDQAFNRGELIRTHLLRPTWHLVTAKDIYWMLELTAPHIISLLRSRHKELGLTTPLFTKSYKVLTKALEGNIHLSKGELMATLSTAKLPMDNSQMYHVLMQAELDGLLCSGALKDGKQTYALLEERVPKGPSIPREEALARLAQRFFASHAPATLQDFHWWSGLPKADVRRALEMIKSGLNSEEVEGEEYWFPRDLELVTERKKSVYLVPAYDEYYISYKSRTAVIIDDAHRKPIAHNGIFRPIIVENGRIIGIWKRKVLKTKVKIETHFFIKPSSATVKLVEKRAAEFCTFLNKDLELS